MPDDFYAALEEEFRGSGNSVRSALKVYRPLLNLIAAKESAPTAIDLGCGRGEWLELAQEAGFAARGCDLDTGMLQQAAKKNLDVVEMDAVEFLRECEDSSTSVISAFHLVEHLETAVLLELLRQSHRVLTPSGVLILETPNPGQLMVATQNFYLDPSHRNPIPAPLLDFMVRYSAFSNISIVKLHSGVPEDSVTFTLTSVLTAGAQDYACLASKSDSYALDTTLKTDFPHGDSLDLAVLFDEQVHNLHIAAATLAQQTRFAEATLAEQARSIESLREDYSELMSVVLAIRGQLESLEAACSSEFARLNDQVAELRNRRGITRFLR